MIGRTVSQEKRTADFAQLDKIRRKEAFPVRRQVGVTVRAG